MLSPNSQSLKQLYFIISIAMVIFAISKIMAEPEPLQDYEIVRAIENDFYFDDGVSSHFIDVKSKDGIVTLTGSIDNLLAEERAVAIAQSIKGVRGVIDKMKVKPVSRTDLEIRTDLVTTLAQDPVTESYEIDAKVNQGVVTLKGSVDSWAERRFAAQVAKSIKGIVDVVNELDVVYTGIRTDREIQNEIEKKLRSDIYINDLSLGVEFDDGVATISGVVGSSAEKERIRFSSYVNGVKDVDVSGLKIEWWADDDMRKQDAVPLLDDDKIRTAVYDALMYDPRVLPTKIDVKVTDGIVSLQGSVTDYRARKAAEEDARNTVGVGRVFNYLKVRPDLVVEDSEIFDYVQTAVNLDPYIDRYQFKFTVINGKVYINGAVDNEFDKFRVETVVGQQPGVVDLANNVLVRKTWNPKGDWAIEKDIREQFFWSMSVDGDDIDLNVENGLVTLEGDVDSKYELQAAVKNAYEGGAKTVKNELTVNNTPAPPDFLNRYDFYHYRW
jgi:osmotically-inducible protein OsmY